MDYFLHPEIHGSLQFHDVTLNSALLEAYRKGEMSAENYEKFSAMNRCHCAYTLSIEPNGTVSHCNLVSHGIGNICHELLCDILSKEMISCANYACYPQFSKAGDGILSSAIP